MSARPRSREIQLTTRVQQKAPNLPCYFVVPAGRADSLGIQGTTVVEVEIDGAEVGRRTLKRWDDHRWFTDLSARVLRRVGVAVGDRIRVVLRPASQDLPDELVAVIESDGKARRVWASFTDSDGSRFFCNSYTSSMSAAIFAWTSSEGTGAL